MALHSSLRPGDLVGHDSDFQTTKIALLWSTCEGELYIHILSI